MRQLATALVLAGCATSYQSARTLPPGKAQVTVGLARLVGEVQIDEQPFDDDPTPTFADSESRFTGDLQVRMGVADRVDFGIRFQRTPGGREAASFVSIDPKLMLTKPGARLAVSAGLPVGVFWLSGDEDEQMPATTMTSTTKVVAMPSVFVGVELVPGYELVLSPKALVGRRDDDKFGIDFGGSVGMRCGDPARSWAVHPEVGVFRSEDQDGTVTLVTLGFAISAGN